MTLKQTNKQKLHGKVSWKKSKPGKQIPTTSTKDKRIISLKLKELLKNNKEKINNPTERGKGYGELNKNK